MKSKITEEPIFWVIIGGILGVTLGLILLLII